MSLGFIRQGNMNENYYVYKLLVAISKQIEELEKQDETN